MLRSHIEKNEPNMKRSRGSQRKTDKISELPNCILLYIMTFLSTLEVVRTSVLSKRWNNLWKHTSNLITNNTQFQTAANFRSFVNKFLTHRDRLSSLQKIAVDFDGFISFQILTKLFRYEKSHKMESITINTFGAGYKHQNIEITNILLSCRFLKHLELSFRETRGKVIFSHTLNLPELTYCHLKEVSFSSNDENTCVNPFSGCKKLNTLIIDCCNLIGTQKLFVSNDNISNLIIRFDRGCVYKYKIQMNTPNLKTFTFVGHFGYPHFTRPLFVTGLKLLEETSFEFWFPRSAIEKANNLINKLKVLNVSQNVEVRNY